jgi:hypothetical protein
LSNLYEVHASRVGGDIAYHIATLLMQLERVCQETTWWSQPVLPVIIQRFLSAQVEVHQFGRGLIVEVLAAQ